MAITVNTEPDEWAGVFNEILVEFQRKDFVVTSINGTDLVLTAPGSADLDADDYIYLYGDDGAGSTDSGFYTIATKSSNTVFTISAAFSLIATSGFLNSDDVRSDYYLALLAEDTVYLKIVPDPTGLCSADISENLIYLLTAANISDYVTKYSQDTYLGASYDLEYTEVYNDSVQTAVAVGTYYVVFAALGYTDMSDYIVEPSGTPNTNFAKWLTEFEELAYWNGQDFDVSIINSFSSATLFVKEEIHLLNGTSSTNSYALSNMAGVLRIQLTGSYAASVSYINLYLFDTTRNRLTEKIRINIHQVCANSMSMAWINTLGGMDYWTFPIRQDYSVNVNTEKTIYLASSEFDYSKKGNEKIKLYADDIDTAHESGLKGLLYCLQAFLYESSTYVAVRINAGETFLYRTDSTKFNIEIEAIKKRLNLGHL